ncbi:MAG TPA: hypothetical protein VL981_12755 [Candidatus Methylacidiphilales bacterium]|nr:hypothetical protein [Candidatus Methylacidiphilales bacterium]
MSSSIFGKDPAKQPVPDPFARERIEKEIEHLKKPQSTRYGANQKMSLGIFTCCLGVFILLGLFLMDPFKYAWYRGDAIEDYLYLHNYDSDQKANALVATGILSPDDATILNRRQGSFQDYFASPAAAEQKAEDIIAFMKGLSELRNGPYTELDTLGKIRYNLFCRWGLIPPSSWTILNPKVKTE